MQGQLVALKGSNAKINSSCVRRMQRDRDSSVRLDRVLSSVCVGVFVCHLVQVRTGCSEQPLTAREIPHGLCGEDRKSMAETNKGQVGT